MSKHWKDVKAAIEKDIDRIWFEEPEEVKMSRLGISPVVPVLTIRFWVTCSSRLATLRLWVGGLLAPPFRPLCPMTPSVWSTASACGSI